MVKMIRNANNTDAAAVSPFGTPAATARHQRAARSAEYAREWDALTAAREIAWQLIRYRMDNELTQQQLAERAQTSHSQISRLESGQHLPSITSLGKIANALGLKLVVSFERYADEAKPHAADELPGTSPTGAAGSVFGVDANNSLPPARTPTSKRPQVSEK